MKMIIKLTLSFCLVTFVFASPTFAQSEQEKLCQTKAKNKTGCKCAVQTGGAVRENGTWTTPRGPGRQTFAACVEKNGGSMR
jgi:hypothetical protein